MTTTTNEHHDNNNPQHQQQQHPPPSEEFSNVMTQILMGMEELRRSMERSTAKTTTATRRRSHNDHTTGTGSSTHRHGHDDDDDEVENVFQYQADLDALLPCLDQLARWTADRADPTSMEADLFRHVQQKILATAQQTLHVMMQCPEPTSASNTSENDPTQDGGGDPINDNDDDGGGSGLEELLRDYQGAVAQTTELNLRLLLNNPLPPEKNDPATSTTTTPDKIVQSYISFQRQTFRNRVKPAIAQLVQERKRGFSSSTTTTTVAVPHQKIQIYKEDDNGDDDESTTAHHPAALFQYEKHHANTLAVILGQAAALIHPLLAWQVNLPDVTTTAANFLPPNNSDALPYHLSRLCVDSIDILNEQAQQLAKTVSDWFWEDRPVEQFMEQMAASADDHDHSNASTTTSETATPDLGMLDSVVEEMALVCLLLAQYQSLILSNSSHDNQHDARSETTRTSSGSSRVVLTIPNELLPEWSWKYAALERYLAIQQWHKAALQVAQPVQIVMGTQIYVPSVVEDAQYLSTRALERAASTQALPAMGTVAHAIAHDVWSTELSGGVHQAVVVDERGCWIEPEHLDNNNNNNKNQHEQHAPSTTSEKSNTFASALLDALDEDLGGPAPPNNKSSTKSPTNQSSKSSNAAGHRNKKNTKNSSQPSSGNFLSALALSNSNTHHGGGGGGSASMRLLQMHAKFCALNGMHAAAGACRSLVEYLDGLLYDYNNDNPNDDNNDNEEDEQNDQERRAESDNTLHNNTQVTSSSRASAEDAKATAMIQLAREELFRYANTYEATLKQKVAEMVAEYAKLLPDNPTKKNEHDEDDETMSGILISDSHDGLCLDFIGSFIAHESYQIDAKTLQKLERDERLEAELMGPLRQYVFLQQIAARLEYHVLLVMAEHLVGRVVQVILVALWRLQKPFTDWGSLLLSKQVRLLQTYVEHCVTPTDTDTGALFAASSGLVGKWERLTQIVAILQLEQPAEWLLYYNNNNAQSVLTPKEVARTMALRVDFQPEAIAAVTNQLTPKQQQK